MGKNLSVVILMVLNLVGNPVSADSPKSKTIIVKKEKKEFDYCLHDVERGTYLCASDPKANGDKKYTILNKSAAMEKGIVNDSFPLKDCYNADGSNAIKCKYKYKQFSEAKTAYVDVPRKALDEAGVVVKTLKYCTYVGPWAALRCTLKGQENKGSELVMIEDARAMDIPYKGTDERNGEMTDIKNCIVNEHDNVVCDALRPNGDKTLLYTKKGNYKLKGVELRVKNTCETVTRDYVVCDGNRYVFDKSGIGPLAGVVRGISSVLGNTKVESKCSDLYKESVVCNDSRYVRDMSGNDSSRSAKDSEAAESSVKVKETKTSTK